jgi:hypothetical protein
MSSKGFTANGSMVYRPESGLQGSPTSGSGHDWDHPWAAAAALLLLLLSGVLRVGMDMHPGVSLHPWVPGPWVLTCRTHFTSAPPLDLAAAIHHSSSSLPCPSSTTTPLLDIT